MSTYDKILTQFRKLGLNQDSYINQGQMLKLLDSIASQNAGFNQFDRNIAEQLWGHCQSDLNRGVKLNDYINTVVEADNILRRQAAYAEQALKNATRKQQRTQLQEQYRQIKEDHHIISSPFRLPPLSRSTILQPESLPSFDRGPVMSPSFPARQESHLTHQEEDTSAPDLRIAMFIAFFMLLCELILMFHKHHFLNILCIFAILSIFFLNYFDKDYIKFLLILLIASFVFDIVWLGVNAREYWSPDIETQHSTLHSGFLGFIFIMVIIMMVLKIVVFGILVKYRNNPQSIRKSVSAFGYRIKLDGRPTYNPFTPLLKSAN